MNYLKYNLKKDIGTQFFSKEISKEGVKLFKKQIKDYIKIRDNFKPANYLIDGIVDGKLILPRNTLLHFSKCIFYSKTGSAVDWMLKQIKDFGLLNGGAMGAWVENRNETHAVVDCWKIKDLVSYEVFANLNSEVKNPSVLDRTYGKYVPFKHLTDFSENELPNLQNAIDKKDNLLYQGNLLHRIGWIITPHKSEQVNKYLNKDIFLDDSIAAEFKGPNFNCHVYDVKDDSNEKKTKVRHATVLFGIPENLISGLILNYDDLYDENFLRIVYGYFNDKVIAAPNGEVIHVPSSETNLNKKQQDQQLNNFLKKVQDVINKEENLLNERINNESLLNL